MNLAHVFTLTSLLTACLSQRLPAQPVLDARVPRVASAGGGASRLAGDLSPSEGERGAAIPPDQIGALAGKQYSGDGLSVCATEGGARLRCVFQRLEAEATPEGLWLTSTVNDAVKDRFRVMAAGVGRSGSRQSAVALEAPVASPERQTTAPVQGAGALPRSGTVAVTDKLVRFFRPGLIEEHSVSMDGVRQDFVVLEKPGAACAPATDGELVVELTVAGAKVETTASGPQLVLEYSGRKIAYGQLRVIDSTGRELRARMEVRNQSEIRNAKTDTDLVVVVNDTGAMYPLRIDPTFSDANWISMGGISGVDGSVYAAVVDDSGNLYVGGSFTIAADLFATNIAKWNGSSWSALGTGMSRHGTVYALAVSSSDLYAGGHFTTAGGVAATNIAKWNGSSWSALGSGLDRTDGDYADVLALAVLGNDLYAGGKFTTAGGVTVNRIAKWNGSSWSALGSGMSDHVYALVALGSNLYAGGYFRMADGDTVNAIARWDGNSWSALGSGIEDGYVMTLVVLGSDLCVGGSFTIAGGVNANSIAKWNGSNWSALGSGMNNDVYALEVSGDELYAGGVFTKASGVTVNRIAKWNGSSWSALGSGMNNDVHALAASGDVVFAGGYFSVAGGVAAKGIAKWSTGDWSALAVGPKLYDWVFALAASGSDLYVGGQFSSVGGTMAKAIARWDGNSWSALGSGIEDGYVMTLAVSGADLYVGGNFTIAGGVNANSIAKWNGSNWAALGSGLSGTPQGYNPTVYALALSDSNLYAGGNFTTAGGISANCIAKWDGNSWSALGSGVSGGHPADSASPVVRALALSDSKVYAGGLFNTAGGNSANNIAEWNGSSWSALDSGTGPGYICCPYSVSALEMSSGNLYAGGFFVLASDPPASAIARWDGNSWSALGSGLNGWVRDLAVSGADLYAGGVLQGGWRGSSHKHCQMERGQLVGLEFRHEWRSRSGRNVRQSPVSGGLLYGGERQGFGLHRQGVFGRPAGRCC